MDAISELLPPTLETWIAFLLPDSSSDPAMARTELRAGDSI